MNEIPVNFIPVNDKDYKENKASSMFSEGLTAFCYQNKLRSTRPHSVKLVY